MTNSQIFTFADLFTFTNPAKSQDFTDAEKLLDIAEQSYLLTYNVEHPTETDVFLRDAFIHEIGCFFATRRSQENLEELANSESIVKREAMATEKICNLIADLEAIKADECLIALLLKDVLEHTDLGRLHKLATLKKAQCIEWFDGKYEWNIQIRGRKQSAFSKSPLKVLTFFLSELLRRSSVSTDPMQEIAPIYKLCETRQFRNVETDEILSDRRRELHDAVTKTLKRMTKDTPDDQDDGGLSRSDAVDHLKQILESKYANIIGSINIEQQTTAATSLYKPFQSEEYKKYSIPSFADAVIDLRWFKYYFMDAPDPNMDDLHEV